MRSKSFSLRATMVAIAMGLLAGTPHAYGGDNGIAMFGQFAGLLTNAIQADVERKQRARHREADTISPEQQFQGWPPSLRTQDPEPAVGHAPSYDNEPSPSHNMFPYKVDGRRLGEVVPPLNLSADFPCRPSDQFDGFQWCSRSQAKRRVGAASTLLLTSALQRTDGTLAFYEKFINPSQFRSGEIDQEIMRLSSTYHEAAKIFRMPARQNGTGAVLATWGDLVLRPVDSLTYVALAQKKSVRSGIMIDFLGNFSDSAKQRLPIYRMTGRRGYFYVAQSDEQNRGHLRFGMIDPSLYESPAINSPAIANADATPRPIHAADAIEPAVARPAEPSSRDADGSNDFKAAGLRHGLDQGRRVALVIGNSAYQAVPRLGNPDNDAEAVAQTLRSVGFDSVRLIEDANYQQMKEAFRDFQDLADTSDWAMVYYAGHGIEAAGENYIIPIDAHLSTDRNAADEAFSLRYVLDKMRKARRLQLVVLDACRENPFQNVMKREEQVASRSVTRGFGRYEPRTPSEMVVYAARDGEQALDATDRTGHSPFTSALISRMRMEGLEINKMFRLITADVLNATNNQQQPFVYGSTPGEVDFYFNPEAR